MDRYEPKELQQIAVVIMAMCVRTGLGPNDVIYKIRQLATMGTTF